MKEENKRICSKCFVNFRKKQHSTIQLNPPHPTPPPLLPLNKWKGNQISDTDLSIVFHDRLHRCKHPGCEHICLAFRSSNKYNNTTQHRAHKALGRISFGRLAMQQPGSFTNSASITYTSKQKLMDLIETRRSAGSLYTEMIKDAYRPAKRHCIRSQSTIDLQAVVSGHLRHPADGTYSAPDEVVDRGIGPQTSGDTTDETVDSHHFRHRFRCRSSPPPQHVWVAKTTGTFYKPLYERTNVYGNRRYYSRYGNNDPEYFDWDLDAAVSRVKEQQAISYGRPPVQPRYWEHQLFKDMSYLQGEKLISPYLFNKTDDSSNFTKTTYVSSALRTPSYWTYRFENL
ncbi:2-C-methyl-D-erythritol 4-phosphate cytidylyltransferase [Trichinella pseudospiralis]